MLRDEIIEIAKKNHNIEYDYSLVKDSNKTQNIDVICPKHGLFHPRLNRFLKGSNCPFCVGKIKKTNEQFIIDANKVHNGFYYYDKFNYIDAHTESIITCPIHGDFKQNPTNHLSGNGCPECAKAKRKDYQYNFNKETFIEKANKIHNNFYNYNKVIYENNVTKVTITCPIHGDFEQAPHNHLQGKGCKYCNQSHMEREIKICLEKNNIDFEYQKKFDWLGKQNLDFYLPKFNVAIECQGKQHFGEGWSEDKNVFEKILNNDKKKYDLCKKNNIEIIYFSKNLITLSFYNNKKIIYSTNDLLNYFNINKIKNDIINILNIYNINYINNINNIIINNLIIYPVSDLNSFFNSFDKNYFNNISIDADLNGQRVMWIKPFEWYDENKRKVLESFILSACGVIQHRIYARDCYIKEITNNDVKEFLKRTSMYGYRQSSLVLGLFLKKDKGDLKKDTLLMCYTFGKAFYGKGKYDIEVIRASTELNTQVIGGASKLWKYFIDNYKTIKINNIDIEWQTCCYYVDFDHNNGNSLKHLGFVFDHYTEAGFHNVYLDTTKKINRRPSKHNEIKKLVEKGELFKVYNAGTKVFIYKK